MRKTVVFLLTFFAVSLGLYGTAQAASITFTAYTGTYYMADVSINYAVSDVRQSTVEYQLDSDAWKVPEVNQVNLTGLSEGSHTLRMRATANDGSEVSVEQTFNVDLSVAQARIDSGPSGIVAAGDKTFTFSAINSVSRFDCWVNDGPLVRGCSSPYTFNVSRFGHNTFYLRGIGPGGTSGPIVSQKFTTANLADTTKPIAYFKRAPAGQVSPGDVGFEFDVYIDEDPYSACRTGTSFGDEAYPCADYECRLDDGAFAPCASPIVLNITSEGAHRFDVRPIDYAGNVGEVISSSFTVASPVPPDRQAPTARIEYSGRENQIVFDGSRSSDPDGQALTYRWYLNGREVSREATYTYRPTIDAQARVSLTVSDPDGRADSEGIEVVSKKTTRVITKDGKPVLQSRRLTLSFKGKTSKLSSAQKKQIKPLTASLTYSTKAVLRSFYGSKSSSSKRLAKKRLSSTSKQLFGKSKSPKSRSQKSAYSKKSKNKVSINLTVKKTEQVMVIDVG